MWCDLRKPAICRNLHVTYFDLPVQCCVTGWRHQNKKHVDFNHVTFLSPWSWPWPSQLYGNTYMLLISLDYIRHYNNVHTNKKKSNMLVATYITHASCIHLLFYIVTHTSFWLCTLHLPWSNKRDTDPLPSGLGDYFDPTCLILNIRKMI